MSVRIPSSSEPATSPPRPTWEVAHLFPTQGSWGEGEYLSLSGNRLVELCDGNLEVLPAPTEFHQLVTACLYENLVGWVRPRDAGKVLAAPFPIRLGPDTMREPDVMFMRRENFHRRKNEFWDGADLVIEVVSDDDPRRDLEVKRSGYARARIPEYWIVEPKKAQVTVLKLGQEHYEEHGVFGRGTRATSVLLEGFGVDVSAVFDVK